MSLNLDALEVTSFETTTPDDQASAVTGSACDSPWCAQTFDRACNQEAEAGY